MKKSSNDTSGNFVVEFLLKTEKWHEHRIDKMMNILTDLYQQKQRCLLAKYNEYLANTAEGKALTDAIEEAKAISKDESVSEKDKKSAWNKVNSARKAFHEYLKTIESSLFTKFTIKGLFDGYSKTITYKNNKVYNGINSEMLRYLGECVWKSWDKKINTYNKDIHIHIDKKDKKFKKVNIIKSSYSNSNGQIKGFIYSLDEHSITLRDVKSKSQNNNGTPITLSFVVNDKSIYEKEAFKKQVRNIAIVRKQIRGKNKYYVQFTFAGKPYNKVNIGSGTGAIDPSLKKMTFLSMDKDICQIMNLAPSVTEDVKMINKLQRKLDCIRRTDNPDNYNPDGTIKKYNSDGTIKKLVWNESDIYIMYKNKLADMKRKYAAKRKIDHNKLANELIKLCNEFKVEKNDFKSMQARSKETKKNKNGKFLSKKRYGKSIRNYAPSMFLKILENKLRYYSTGRYVEVPSGSGCTAYDFTNGEFTKHPVKERTITTSDGHTHHRDAFAAFNIYYYKETTKNKETTEKRAIKNKDNFDNDAMKVNYEKFKILEANLL